MPTDEILIVFPPARATVSGVDVAIEQGWRHAQTIDRAEKRFYEEIYRVDDGGTVVRFIDDHFVMVVFAAVTGPDREKAAAIIQKSLGGLDFDGLVRWLSSPEERRRAHAIRGLGAICPNQADPRWVDAFEKAVHDPSVQVRLALADSLARAAWPELWPVLDDFARDEKDDSVRAEIQQVREAYAANLPHT